MIYNITGYYNTGFDGINIPSSPAILQYVEKKIFPDVYLWQDKEVTSVRLNTNWEDIENIDYVSIGDKYYFVVGLKMENENTATLLLTMDYINSAGGVLNIGLVSGWCKRAHTDNDGLYSNVIPEPFTPSEPLEIRGIKFNQWGEENAESYVVSSVSLTVAERLAERFDLTDTSGGAGSVIVPVIPKLNAKEETIYKIINVDPETSGHRRTELKQKCPNTRIYRLEDVKDTLQLVRSLGISDAILGCYCIPPYFATFFQDSTGVINSINGQYSRLEIEDITPIYGTAQNKKVYSLFNTVYLQAMGSGAEFMAEMWQVRQPDNKLSVIVVSDPSPNGGPYFQFQYFNGKKQKVFQNAIKGATWRNTPIVYDNRDGAGIRVDAMQKRMSTSQSALAIDIGANIITTGLGVGGAITKGIYEDLAGMDTNTYLPGYTPPSRYTTWGEQSYQMGGNIINGFSSSASGGIGLASLYNRGETLFNEMREFITGETYVAPSISFPRSATLQGYMGNGFMVYRVGLSDNDLQRFDRFLNMYGYAQSKPLEVKDFTSRVNFNFVQAVSVELKNNFSLRLNKGIESQLAGGVRLWHKIPNKQYYNNNPIKGG